MKHNKWDVMQCTFTSVVKKQHQEVWSINVSAYQTKKGLINMRCLELFHLFPCHVTTQENKFSGHYALLLQKANRHQDSKGKQKEIQKQILCDSVTTQVLCNSVLCHEHRACGARNPGRYPHPRSEEGRRRRRGRVARERVRHHPDW